MILTPRQLNRALLQRQLLLDRADMPIMAAVEHLVGLQAQIPNPPYIGLWTRLRAVERDDLTRLMEARQIVRAAMWRSTLHLVTAADHQRFREVIQPALEKGFRSFYGKRGRLLDVNKLVAAAQPFLEAAPRTTGELKEFLSTIAPERDPDAMAYAIRTYLPLVQVPPGGTWGAGSRSSYTTADRWLEPGAPADLRALLHRYLVAFGPASVMDFQFWTGMTKLGDALQPLLGELVRYETEDGRALFDLPDMPLPDPDTPAPLRLVPEYDNLVIAHADRTRIIADDDYNRVFLSAARVLGTVLIDGFVAGTWKLSKQRKTVTITITPFADPSPANRDGLAAEAEDLLRFVDPDASQHIVDFVAVT